MSTSEAFLLGITVVWIPSLIVVSWLTLASPTLE